MLIWLDTNGRLVLRVLMLMGVLRFESSQWLALGAALSNMSLVLGAVSMARDDDQPLFVPNTTSLFIPDTLLFNFKSSFMALLFSTSGGHLGMP